MRLMLARLVFLAFAGLTGVITYNALYLQELRNQSVVPKIIRSEMSAPALPLTGIASAPAPAAKVPAVTTDLPRMQVQEAPEQLVTAIQRELSARGYVAGPADGKLSDGTRRAISAFEKDKGLPVTGQPSDDLLRYILLGETIPSGPNTGSVTNLAANDTPAPNASQKADPTVRQVQQILADLGYSPGPADGAMGSETERAVSAFQRDRKLTANGQITAEMLREIKSVTGRDLRTPIP